MLPEGRPALRIILSRCKKIEQSARFRSTLKERSLNRASRYHHLPDSLVVGARHDKAGILGHGKAEHRSCVALQLLQQLPCLEAPDCAAVIGVPNRASQQPSLLWAQAAAVHTGVAANMVLAICKIAKPCLHLTVLSENSAKYPPKSGSTRASQFDICAIDTLTCTSKPSQLKAD